MAKLSIEYRPIGDLKPRPTNPRTHSKKQIEQIAASIHRFGFTNPVLIDDGNGVIAGHGRLEAAKLIGMDEVPTVRLSDMREAEIRAYVIADNRLAENAGWDRELLALEFAYLSALDIDLDVTITGFELPEIDILLDELHAAPAIDSDGADNSCPDVTDGPAVTRPGDLWVIGDHKLYCGDALQKASYDILMGDERAQMVFTDPPYNVPIEGHVSGLGRIRHREFAMASGEMTREEFIRFLVDVMTRLAAYSAEGALHFICMDWRHAHELLMAGDGVYDELKNICVWAKTNAGMGSLYRSQHELVFVFKSGTTAHINNVELGRHGRNRTNVWTYAGVNSFGQDRGDLALHPTVKPVDLVADAIRDCSHRKGIVLDAFGGSGTTLIAAERTGRFGRAIEIDPHYCDVIVRRMKQVCGIDAVLAGTSQSFADVEAERLASLATEEVTA